MPGSSYTNFVAEELIGSGKRNLESRVAAIEAILQYGPDDPTFFPNKEARKLSIFGYDANGNPGYFKLTNFDLPNIPLGLQTPNGSYVTAALLDLAVEQNNPFDGAWAAYAPGSKSPIGMYLDAGMTTPATADGADVDTIRDQVFGTGQTFSYLNSKPKLRFRNGYPCLRFTAGANAVMATTPNDNVKHVWAIVYKDDTADHGNVLGNGETNNGLYETSGFYDFGGVVANGGTAAGPDPAIPLNSALDKPAGLMRERQKRLIQGNIIAGKVHYSVNGWTMHASDDGVTTMRIGGIAHTNVASARFSGDVFMVAWSTKELTWEAIDSISIQLMRDFKIDVPPFGFVPARVDGDPVGRSLMTPLLCCEGTSMMVGADAGRGFSVPEIVAKTTRGHWRIENLGVGGSNTQESIDNDLSGKYYSPSGIKAFLFWGFTNDAVSAETSLEGIIARTEELLEIKRAQGFNHFALIDGLDRADIPWGTPGNATYAEFTSKRKGFNAWLQSQSEIGRFYRVQIDDIVQLQNPMDMTYFSASRVHLNAAGNALVAPRVLPWIESIR